MTQFVYPDGSVSDSLQKSGSGKPKFITVGGKKVPLGDVALRAIGAEGAPRRGRGWGNVGDALDAGYTREEGRAQQLLGRAVFVPGSDDYGVTTAEKKFIQTHYVDRHYPDIAEQVHDDKNWESRDGVHVYRHPKGGPGERVD